MFYLLHRLVKWFFVLLAFGCVFWVWTQRAAFEPLWVWYDVYENGGIQKTGNLSVVNGQGIGVFDGHTFQMKNGNQIISVRLTGFDLPEPPLTPAQIAEEKRRREFLRNAVVGKPVQVEITYSNANSLLGVVHADGTNLNTYYVTSGLGHFNREYVKSTPRDLQYKFFAAARAKSQQLAQAGE
jgi:endonuclease YncB( thermonuclease family)